MNTYPDIKRLIPHRPPFVMVDKIIQMTDTTIVAEKTFPDNGYGIRDHFVLEGLLIEVAAQTVAAKQGFNNLNCGRPPSRGMLVSVGNLDFFSSAKTEMPLRIYAEKQTTVGKFSILTFSISQENTPIAKGTLQLFLED